MVDFANSFPDAHIMKQLGDDIELVDTNGKSTFIKGVFDFEWEDEELADQLSLKIPYVDVTINTSNQISNQRIRYNGEQYIIHHRRPIDTGMTRLILRSVKAV